MIQKFLGRERFEIAYWNGYNDAIGEAIHIAGSQGRRVTNFYSDHDRFGLDVDEVEKQFVQDSGGVGDSRGSAVQKEKKHT